MDRNGSNVLYYRSLNYGMGYVQLPNGTLANSGTAAAAAAAPQLNGLSSAALPAATPSNGLLPGLTAPTAATAAPAGSFMQKWMIPHLTPSQINFLFKNRMDKKKAQTPVKCDTCGIVLNSEQQAKQHFDGKAHLKKLRKMGLPIPEEHMGKVVGKAGKRRYPCICKDNPDKDNPDKEQDENIDKESSPEKDSSSSTSTATPSSNTNSHPEGSDPDQKDGSTTPSNPDPDAPPNKKRRFFHRRRWKPYKCEVCNCGNDWEFKNKDSNESGKPPEGTNEDGENEDSSINSKVNEDQNNDPLQNVSDADKSERIVDNNEEEINNDKTLMSNNNLSNLGLKTENKSENVMVLNNHEGGQTNLSCNTSSSLSLSSGTNSDKMSTSVSTSQSKLGNDKTSKLTNYLNSVSSSKNLVQSQSSDRRAVKRDSTGKVAKNSEIYEKVSDNSSIVTPKINYLNTSIGIKGEIDQNGNQSKYQLKKNCTSMFTNQVKKDSNENSDYMYSCSNESMNVTLSVSPSNSQFMSSSQIKTVGSSSGMQCYNGNNTTVNTLSSISSPITKSVLNNKSVTSTIPVSKHYGPGKIYPQVPGIGIAAVSQKLSSVAGTGIVPPSPAGVPQTSNASLYNGQGLISGSSVLGLGSSNNNNQRHVPLSYQTLPQSQNSLFGMTNGHINSALSPASTPFSTALSLPSVSPQTLYYPTYANSSLTEQSYTQVGGNSPTNSALNNLYSPYLSTQPVASAMVLSDQTYTVMPSIDLNANQAYTFGCSGNSLTGTTLLPGAFTGIQTLSQNGGLKGDASGYSALSAGKEPLAVSSGYYDDLNTNNNNNDHDASDEENDFDLDTESFFSDDDFFVPNNISKCKIKNTFKNYEATSSLSLIEDANLGYTHDNNSKEESQLSSLNCDKFSVSNLVSDSDVVEDPVTAVQQPPPEQPDGSKLDPISQGVIDNIQGKLPTKRKIEVPCTVCNIIFNSESQAHAHFQGSKHAKRVKELGVTESSTPSPAVPAKKWAFGKDDYICEPCEKFFTSAKQLQQHLQSLKHKEQMEGCSNTMQAQGEYKYNEPSRFQSVATKFQSGQVFGTGPNTPSQVDHICEPCERSFNSAIQLQQHLQSLKHKEQIEGCSNTMDVQGRSQKEVPSLFQSVATKFPSGQNFGVVSNEQSQVDHICEPCERSFNSAIQLQQHLQSLKHKEQIEGCSNTMNVQGRSQKEVPSLFQSVATKFPSGQNFGVVTNEPSQAGLTYAGGEKGFNTTNQFEHQTESDQQYKQAEQSSHYESNLQFEQAEQSSHYESNQQFDQTTYCPEGGNDMGNVNNKQNVGSSIGQSTYFNSNQVNNPPQPQIELGQYSKLGKDFYCHPCEKSFNSQQQLNSHVTSAKHRTRIEQPNHCLICEVSFNSESQAQVHYQSDKHNRKLDAYNSESNFYSKPTTVNAVLACEACEKSFNSAKQLQVHLSSQNHQLTIQQPTFCKVCQRNFNSEEQASSHYSSQGHWNKFESYSEKLLANVNVSAKKPQCSTAEQYVNSLKEMFACEVCQKSVNSAKQLQVHLWSEKHKQNIEQPTFCKICDKMFNSEYQAQEHYNSGLHMNKLVKYSENILSNLNCDLVFGKKEAMKRRHPDEELPVNKSIAEFSCWLCSKRFNSATQLKNHLKSPVHKTNVEKPTQCVICNMFFESEVEAQKHYETEDHKAMFNESTEIGSAKHSCWLCEKYYDTTDQLKQHLDDYRHKDFVEQPLACLICLKSFTSEVQGQAHYLSQKHCAKLEEYGAKVLGDFEENQEASEEYGITDVPVKEGKVGVLDTKDNVNVQNTGVKESDLGGEKEPLTCLACNKTFNSDTQKQQHFASPKHLTQCSLCSICDSAFKSMEEAIVHYQSMCHAENVRIAAENAASEPGLEPPPAKVSKPSSIKREKINSSLFKKGAEVTIDINDTTFTIDAGEMFKCACCGVLVNSMVQLAQHYAGSTHKKNAASWTGQPEEPTQKNPLVVATPVQPKLPQLPNLSNTTNGSDSSKGSFLCGEVKGHKGGWFYCQACDISVPTAVTLQLHIQSEYHKDKGNSSQSS